ncbi:MAG: molybdopterin-dependent oxidoreductase [Chloroflexi bacterium]|nr:molybdopterin-dependent oxidoreductase [Chloroflexota bacterium]
MPEGNGWHVLCVGGLVQRSLILTAHDLAHFPRTAVVSDFTCEEGWVVPGLDWEGVPVALLLEITGTSPGAKYLVFSSGDFSVRLTMREVIDLNPILAVRLNGRPLPAEFGGPCRLIVPGKPCHHSIKWIDQIRVTAGPVAVTGPDIANARIGRAGRNSGPNGASKAA